MDSINWEDASPAEYEYNRAAQGIPHSPPAHVYRRWHHLEGGILDVAAEAIIVARNVGSRQRSSAYVTADDIVCDYLGIDCFFSANKNKVVAWHQLLSYAMSIAKSDTRYWGVDDPTTHSYCSACREPVPIEEFNESPYKCDLHF